MPRTPRNPGSGKRPHNGPARGAGHGYGKGQWGGEAKGASTSRIKPGDPDGIQAMRNDPAKITAREERLKALKDHLFGLALGAEREETQLSATVAFLNREEGMPTQNVKSEVTRSYVVRAPAKPESTEEWVKQHQPRQTH